MLTKIDLLKKSFLWWIDTKKGLRNLDAQYRLKDATIILFFIGFLYEYLTIQFAIITNKLCIAPITPTLSPSGISLIADYTCKPFSDWLFNSPLYLQKVFYDRFFFSGLGEGFFIVSIWILWSFILFLAIKKIFKKEIKLKKVLLAVFFSMTFLVLRPFIDILHLLGIPIPSLFGVFELPLSSIIILIVWIYQMSKFLNPIIKNRFSGLISAFMIGGLAKTFSALMSTIMEGPLLLFFDDMISRVIIILLFVSGLIISAIFSLFGYPTNISFETIMALVNSNSEFLTELINAITVFILYVLAPMVVFRFFYRKIDAYSNSNRG